jgi:ribosomal protein S21
MGVRDVLRKFRQRKARRRRQREMRTREHYEGIIDKAKRAPFLGG